VPPNLRKHFVQSDMTRDSAIRAAMAGGESRAAPSRFARWSAAAAPLVRTYPNLGVMLGNVTAEGLERLRRDERVAAVTGAPELSLIRPRQVMAVKAAAQVTWGITLLEIARLWDQGLTGKGVVVAHLDTGADGRHPALKGAIAKFAQFDDLGNQAQPDPAAFDSSEHGTHTAATIAGRTASGVTMGVAPGAQLASAMVIEGGNVIARVLGGLDWALANGASVLSMSLGIRGWVEDFVPIMQLLRSRGVLPVVAVGNEGPGTSRSPGNYAEVLSVGATGPDRVLPRFSSSQRFVREKDPIVPDLVAPGVDVISAVPGGEFKSMSGTSMATPHVAGLAALLFQAKPEATVDQIEDAIFRSCALAPGMAQERAGRGIPNGPRALSILTGPPIPAAPVVPVKASARMPKRKSARRSTATRSEIRSRRKSGTPQRLPWKR
jgi:subtilisin family serine protease